MSIDKHDTKIVHCRMLGHEVPFAYCRSGATGQPCRKIFDCWFETFDIRAFMAEHFSAAQIQALLAPPKPKVNTLLDCIQQARTTAKKDG